jgi:hypothetical protein
LTAACAVAEGTAMTSVAVTSATVRFIVIPVPFFLLLGRGRKRRG